MDGQDVCHIVLEINPKQKAIIVSNFSESDRVHDAQAFVAGACVRNTNVIETLASTGWKELEQSL
jgi:hypothetical protein